MCWEKENPASFPHTRPPGPPKLWSFSAHFFYLESFPQTLSQVGMCMHTLALTPLVFK